MFDYMLIFSAALSQNGSMPWQSPTKKEVNHTPFDFIFKRYLVTFEHSHFFYFLGNLHRKGILMLSLDIDKWQHGI